MKIIGITEYAYRHLTVEDCETLESFLHSECEFSITDENMLIMPDGDYWHKDYVILKNIQQ